MASSPSISVVIPAYNAAATIRRAIESVLAQTRKPDEIVIVDDASDDDTAAVAAHGGTVVSLSQRRGAAGARNAGVAAAKGDWIAFLDADDAWLPEKLERQILLAADGISLLFCASEEFTQGRSLGDTFRGRPVSVGVTAWKALLQRNFVATPTVMAPRSLLQDGFDESLPVGEDQDMWIRLALKGELAYVPETLVHVHVQPRSLSLYRGTHQGRFVLPMIRGHVERLRGRLTRGEIRAILAERYANAGHIALRHGDVARGAGFMARALCAGHRPSLLRAAAPVLMQPS